MLRAVVAAFGFLASKEIKAAGVGNLGLQDRAYITTAFHFSISNGFQNARRSDGFKNISEPLAEILVK